MRTVAITGGIACGKSLVGSFLEADGIEVLETDSVAHGVMQPGNEAYNDVVAEFGETVLGRDREIDRRALGDLVFADGRELARLNACVHPHVRAEVARWLDAHRTRGTREVAVIIPLLYEAGFVDGWDDVICVACPENLQLKRLAGRGLADAEARRRIRAQMPVAKKVRLADYVVYNAGTRNVLERQVRKVWAMVRER